VVEVLSERLDPRKRELNPANVCCTRSDRRERIRTRGIGPDERFGVFDRCDLSTSGNHGVDERAVHRGTGLGCDGYERSV
jgi:hypothetical protein